MATERRRELNELIFKKGQKKKKKIETSVYLPPLLRELPH